MTGWRVVALLATPPVLVCLLGLAAVSGAVRYLVRES